MKFLQLQPVYDSLLAEVYRKNKDLSSQSYDFQLNKILTENFSSSHYLVDEMNALGLEARVVFPNAISLQQQWGSENNIVTKNVLVEQINQFDPDIIYIVGAIGILDSSIIRCLKRKPKVIIGWLGSSIPFKTDWSEFDCILSGLPKLRSSALNLGAKNSFEFYPGMPLNIFEHFPKPNDIPKYDIVFVGQCNQIQHARRAEYLTLLAKKELNFGLFLSGDTSHLPSIVQNLDNGPRFGFDMLKTIHDSKISFDCRAKHSFEDEDIGCDHTVNMRIFESTAVGSLLITEEYLNLHQLFEPEKDIITFKSGSDLLEKIFYYLKEHDLRQEISLEGKKTCLEKHNLRSRAADFLCIVDELL